MGIPYFEPRFDTPLLRPFYDALGRGELHLPACSRCARWYWYPTEIAPCHPSAGLEWRPVSSMGTIYTFTTVQRCLLPGDHKKETPYTVLLTEPDDVPGARIPSLWMGKPEREPVCGMRVKLSPVAVGDYTLPGFRPAERHECR